jgi:hypothetical protein
LVCCGSEISVQKNNTLFLQTIFIPQNVPYRAIIRGLLVEIEQNDLKCRNWQWNWVHSALVKINEELLERKGVAPV